MQKGNLLLRCFAHGAQAEKPGFMGPRCTHAASHSHIAPCSEPSRAKRKNSKLQERPGSHVCTERVGMCITSSSVSSLRVVYSVLCFCSLLGFSLRFLTWNQMRLRCCGGAGAGINSQG